MNPTARLTPTAVARRCVTAALIGVGLASPAFAQQVSPGEYANTIATEITNRAGPGNSPTADAGNRLRRATTYRRIIDKDPALATQRALTGELEPSLAPAERQNTKVIRPKPPEKLPPELLPPVTSGPEDGRTRNNIIRKREIIRSRPPALPEPAPENH